MQAPVILVGCGNMGRALLEGWRAQGLDPGGIVVVEPDSERAEAAKATAAVRIAAERAEPTDLDRAAAVVLAVKPQAMAAVAPRYAGAGSGGALFLSIAAGITTTSLLNWLGATAPVVRAMPNTPAQIRRGITVAYACPGVTEGHRALANTLLNAVGEVAWVEAEALLDPVTAVSGSGPAYLFLLAECLAEAGVAAGLPAALAERLARQTIVGAGALLRQAAEPATTLRQRVTSPGGTTAAALAILDGPDGLRPLLQRAVAAATERSRVLGGGGNPTTTPPQRNALR